MPNPKLCLYLLAGIFSFQGAFSQPSAETYSERAAQVIAYFAGENYPLSGTPKLPSFMLRQNFTIMM